MAKGPRLRKVITSPVHTGTKRQHLDMNLGLQMLRGLFSPRPVSLHLRLPGTLLQQLLPGPLHTPAPGYYEHGFHSSLCTLKPQDPHVSHQGQQGEEIRLEEGQLKDNTPGPSVSLQEKSFKGDFYIKTKHGNTVEWNTKKSHEFLR